MSRITRTFTIGGYPFVLRIDPGVKPGTIVMASENDAELLEAAIDDEATTAVASWHNGAQAPPHVEAAIERAVATLPAPPAPVEPVEPAAPLTVNIPPMRAKRRGGTTKIGTLGCTREQLADRLRTQGGRLSHFHQEVLALAVSGRSIDDSAAILKVTPYMVQVERRAAAQQLGFAPKHYPKLSAAISARHAKDNGAQAGAQ